ncbi:hypothetical protein [Kribbella sandramycini]|nr:hypothetical protein [Kribbella sandramycini]
MFDAISEILWQLGGDVSREDGIAQIRDVSGRLFSVEGPVPPDLEWEFRQGPHVLGSGSNLPDFGVLSACTIECRWVDLFVDTMSAIVTRIQGSYWILDAGDVVWDARDIDGHRLAL